jgi:predicted NBD/HSP70 family sugar kinase
MLRFGIDLGGTKTEILALDADGRERLRRRIATPHDDYGGTVTAIAALIRDAERELGEIGSVGIATPGAVSRLTGRIKNANSTCLNNQPLVEDLQHALEREIRIENDANCFALSEATDGAAAGADVVFGVILGTGVGGGVVVHGRTLTGANAIGGEWGHNPLPAPRDDERPGHRCYCGRDGCIETWLSGPGLAKHFLESDGRALDAAMIARAAAEGDASAEAAMSAYEERLAKSLASVINLLDPDVIVLGGGLSKIARLYDNVPKRWAPYVFSDQVVTRLVPPKFGDSSGVRGAAWLWNTREQFSKSRNV